MVTLSFRYRYLSVIGPRRRRSGGSESGASNNDAKNTTLRDQIENRYGYGKGMVSLTPAIDILGVNVGCQEVSAVGGNLFQYLGYGATVALGNDKTFSSDNGFGLLSRRGYTHSKEVDL